MNAIHAAAGEETPSMVHLKVRLSKNALTVSEKRYLKKDKSGRVIEAPEEVLWRVARAIVGAEGACDPDAEKVMETLRWLDDVAYVRFASF